MDIIDEIARKRIINSGLEEIGYWQFNEPIIWALFDHWRNINNSDLPGFILKEGNIFNVEPSLKIPNINAFCITSESKVPYVHDLVKVGVTIAVTKKTCQIIGPSPEASLVIQKINS